MAQNKNQQKEPETMIRSMSKTKKITFVLILNAFFILLFANASFALTLINPEVGWGGLCWILHP